MRAKSKKSANYSRALHSLIHRDDKTLPVEIASVRTKVRIPRKRKVLLRPWPVIPLNNWMKLCFTDPKYSGFSLAGKTLDEWADAQNMLKEFWSRYGKIDQTMVPSNPSQTIPVYLHGDEGRGLGKRPLLVISFQPVMSWVGANSIPSTKHLAIKRFSVTFFSNGLLLPQIPHWVELSCGCLRHAFTTRLVYSVIPSECYAPGGATIDPLLRHLVQDLNQLEQEGLEAEYPKLWLPIYILNPPHQDRICLGVLVKSTVVANFELCRCHGATARSKYIANTWETKGIGPGCESLTN